MIEQWREVEAALEKLRTANAWEARLGFLRGAEVRVMSLADRRRGCGSTAGRRAVGLLCVLHVPRAFGRQRFLRLPLLRAGPDFGGVQMVLPVIDADAAFADVVEASALEWHLDSEVRVRIAAAAVLGVLAARRGAALWLRVKDTLLASVRDNFVRMPLMRPRFLPRGFCSSITPSLPDTRIRRACIVLLAIRCRLLWQH